ncbi:hypothetical protein TNCV_3553841 [Trichonephila clavipes]|nr:hypothetical protein TNCV_3553841 [Trichonephila clavipes]
MMRTQHLIHRFLKCIARILHSKRQDLPLIVSGMSNESSKMFGIFLHRDLPVSLPTLRGGTMIYANVSSYLKSSEETRKVDGRQADTEVRILISKFQAFGDGPRPFEPWSNDEDDLCLRSLSSPNFHIIPMGGCFSSTYLMCIGTLCTAGLQWY